MTEIRRSVPLLAGISMLAIGLAASPVAIDLHPIGIGKNAAFAQAAGGGGGGGGGAGGAAGGATGGATGGGGGAKSGGAATGAATGGDVGQERSGGGAPVGGGAPGGGRPGGGGDMGATNQGGSQGMAAQQGAASQNSMKQPAQGQKMDRETIREVQRKLNQQGYQAGPEDGIVGPRTHKAVSAYQKKMGMHANGVLTQDLADRIMAGS